MILLLPLRPHLQYSLNKSPTDFFRHLSKSFFSTKFCVFYYVFLLVRKIFIFYTKGALNLKFRTPVPKLYIHAFKRRPANTRFKNCLMPLWWPKLKTRMDSPFRLNVFRVHAKDTRYSGTSPPPTVGPFATLSL